MALLKTTQFKGINLNAYYKINSFTITEEGGEPKKYSAMVEVISYTDDTKQYDLVGNNYKIDNLSEGEISISSLYGKLKLQGDFSESTDV